MERFPTNKKSLVFGTIVAYDNSSKITVFSEKGSLFNFDPSKVSGDLDIEKCGRANPEDLINYFVGMKVVKGKVISVVLNENINPNIRTICENCLLRGYEEFPIGFRTCICGNVKNSSYRICRACSSVKKKCQFCLAKMI